MIMVNVCWCGYFDPGTHKEKERSLIFLGGCVYVCVCVCVCVCRPSCFVLFCLTMIWTARHLRKIFNRRMTKINRKIFQRQLGLGLEGWLGVHRWALSRTCWAGRGEEGVPGWLSRWAWPHSLWVRAPRQVLCWQHKPGACFGFCVCLFLPLPCSLSLKNKHLKKKKEGERKKDGIPGRGSKMSKSEG